MIDYKELAEYLIKAENDHHSVSCLTEKISDFNIPMGYRVQDELIKLKKDQGYELIAYKMGLTSQAKMKQMNIQEPIYGAIFDYMLTPDKGEIVMDELIHPKVEAEIAVILNEDIEGPNVTGEQVLTKIKWIFPALEIIDSRYENFAFNLPDVIADNSSSSRVVFGSQMFLPHDFEMDRIGVTLSINGEVKSKGISAAVLGNPVNSVAMLANMLYTDGKGKLPKNTIILTGGITEAIVLTKEDHVKSTYEGMGDVFFQVR
jgi:2-oxo-3-hexenedioate decarboxylase